MSNIEFDKVKKGDKFSRISFGEIVQRKAGSVILKTETGFKFEIEKEIFEKEFQIHNQFSVVQKVTQTELINLFKQSVNNVMTVCFNKKPDPKTVKKQLEEIKERAEKGILDIKELESLVDYSMCGEERVMIGRHYGHSDATGRVQFTDMEVKDKSGNMRLVDPRTIIYMVYKGVKYVK
jgi:hypothetical protein